MKLLYITNQISGAAGLERVLSIKASYLADKLGYEVHIITLNQGDVPLFYDFSDKLIYHDIKVSGNPIKYLRTYRNVLRNKVKEIKPDIISVCDDGLKAFTLPFILRKPCPMIYERHVSKNIEVQTEQASILKKIKTKLVYSLMSFGGKRYDKFVVLTKDNLQEWNLPNLKVISNPLSFYPEETSNVTNKKVLAVGRQCFQKGYDRLLESWKIVSEKFPDWKLEVYGKFEEGAPYHQLAEKLDIDNSVSFHKPVKNIGEVYKEASIYVMSSRFEGFGMVLIEAMAYGVPCVSYNCPCGPQEIISDKKDGFLVDNGNITAFADQIETLIKDQSLREIMGKEAREKASRYLPEQIVPQWDALFTQLTKTTS
ncbi:glycosyltransferase family 4 protein [Aquimarina sp. 2201CG5-10]|uniref:glycosyltransferase family 4 protein n=1 Tax=Aquimarina callyspongiae TaxID=3098150 RepID=UPI002AB4B1F9|nr:glycosyltransferase family 4 protein [Aquimarina sp. 2201CG5-10]MDY8136296.1 glycosyltransferase family 4 protein [Aquimarina sp. 2201CG5-10]